MPDSRELTVSRIVARRTILRALVAAVPFVLGCLPMLGWTEATKPGKRNALDTVALEFLGDNEAVRAVGQAYLTEYPCEGRQSMLAGLQGVTKKAGSNRGTDLFAELQRASRTDFAAGDTVVVDGWILSRTEARICALAATV